jgi:hypothetical protein
MPISAKTMPVNRKGLPAVAILASDLSKDVPIKKKITPKIRSTII